MKRLIGLALVAALLAGGAVAQVSPPAEPPALTKDRISEAELDAMVAGPMALVNDGDLEAGVKAFESLLDAGRKQHGAQSTEVADLLTAFGVALTAADYRKEAIPYLRAAVEVSRSVYGPEHPEFALAVTDVAMALWDQAEDEPPPLEVDEALRTAWRIRVATLGPNHPETAWTLGRLAALAALPSRIDGRPERVEAAIALRLQAIEAMRVGVDPNFMDAVALGYLDLAGLYVRNGRLDEGLGAFERALDELARLQPDTTGATVTIVDGAHAFADLLEEAGHRAEAESIRRRLPDPFPFDGDESEPEIRTWPPGGGRTDA